MKLILSRKGFDSQYGGIPSPILPDGRLVPLPIPSLHDHHTFSDLNMPDIDLAGLLGDLGRTPYRLDTTVHLDPDLNRDAGVRPSDWRPALGQTGNAQSHLASMGVGIGDVFLFFGWFREVDRAAGAWRYVKGSPHLHVIFGWIEVADVLPVVKERARCFQENPWIADHPHFANPGHYDSPLNNLYIAAGKSRFSSRPQFGGGRFRQYSDALRLTMPGCTRSVWALPHWFMPKENRPPLSFHLNENRWHSENHQARLQTVAKGQEFVLDGEHYPEVDAWVGNIIERHV